MVVERHRQREPEWREEQMPAALLIVMSVVQAIEQVEQELALRRRGVEDEPVNQVFFEEIQAPAEREQPQDGRSPLGHRERQSARGEDGHDLNSRIRDVNAKELVDVGHGPVFPAGSPLRRWSNWRK